jgi:carbamoyltransferase
MIVVGLSRYHNSSVCLLIDGEIAFHVENERLSNIKYDSYPFLALNKIKEYVDHVDVIAIAGLNNEIPQESFSDGYIYADYIRHLGKSFYNNKIKIYNYGLSHHLTHAASSFYNSGFDSAVCIVKDGMGSDVKIENKNFIDNTYGRENMSVFTAAYPNNFDLVYREVSVPFKTEPIFYDKTLVVNSLSEGMAFQKTSESFGFHSLDAGKVMGMASYGKKNTQMPKIYNNNGINNNLFKIHNSLLNTSLDFSFNSFQEKADFALELQKSTQENVKQEILEVYKITNNPNICLSGGFFLNCVANYEYLKNIPEEINLYIEPISSDSGTSIGAAKLAWHSESQSSKIIKQKDIYYGPTVLTKKPNGGKKTSAKEVADLLSKGKIIALYQGRSESGPRALGNRSILFDPRVKNGKDIVNKVKQREWFRPFAGTVLHEYAGEWFDLRGLKESPFMMYAVNVHENKQNLIPSIVHIDGSCRIQTLTRNQNKNYYDLINEFYKITGVPILFNTSFNLAGECIVETLEDAQKTLANSDIDYLYLPEFNLLFN